MWGFSLKKNPPKKSEKSEKKIQQIQAFFEDLKSVHLIWKWTTPRTNN